MIADSYSYSHGNNRAATSPPVKVKATYVFTAYDDGYIRAEGTNMPPGVPNVTDMDGNFLPDNLKDNIPCTDEDCPPHVSGILDFDLEAWSILSFHSNPIFVRVED